MPSPVPVQASMPAHANDACDASVPVHMIAQKKSRKPRFVSRSNIRHLHGVMHNDSYYLCNVRYATRCGD